MGFTLLANREEWESYRQKTADALTADGAEVGLRGSGPQQYPTLVAQYVTAREPNHITGQAQCDVVFAFVYAGDCLELMKKVDPQNVQRNLYKTGQVWAAEMIQAGYNNAAGRARFISRKMFDSVWEFCKELRTVPALLGLAPDEHRKFIDCVILVETIAKRSVDQGHYDAEEEIQPMLDLVEQLDRDWCPETADAHHEELRASICRKLTSQIRQLQTLAASALVQAQDWTPPVERQDEQQSDYAGCLQALSKTNLSVRDLIAGHLGLLKVLRDKDIVGDREYMIAKNEAISLVDQRIVEGEEEEI